MKILKMFHSDSSEVTGSISISTNTHFNVVIVCKDPEI